jgi:peroxiredoxin
LSQAAAEELPYLNKFKKYHPNVRVVGVTFDTVQDVADFVAKREVHFEIVADAQAFIDKVRVSKYPFIVLLSPEGRRVSSIQGAVSIQTSTNRKVNLLEPWFKRVAPKT